MSGQVFGAGYSSAYDALYGDKDYAAECDLLERVFREFGDGPVRSVLDLGCGTGGHAVELARRGYAVTGVDISEHMLAQARHKAGAVELPAGTPPPAFALADVRTVHLGETFDAAVMMFAVLGYQTTNDDVLAALRAVRAHLRPGGVFAFDVWYGPAVARIGPGERVKVVDTAGGSVIRAAGAELDERHGLCRVSYRLWDTGAGDAAREVAESHTMRYFYPMELELLLSTSGLELRRLCAFPRLDEDVSADSWNAFAVAATAAAG